MAHIYLVEWSAPIIKNSKNIRVLANNKTDAIARAKKKLGNKVRQQHLHHFYAIRVNTK